MCRQLRTITACSRRQYRTELLRLDLVVCRCVVPRARTHAYLVFVACGSGRSLWLCLTCSLVHCGRYINQDSLKHSRQTNNQHCITIEVDEHKVYWLVHTHACTVTLLLCSYACEDFVVNDTVDGKIAAITQSLQRLRALRCVRHARILTTVW